MGCYLIIAHCSMKVNINFFFFIPSSLIFLFTPLSPLSLICYLFSLLSISRWFVGLIVDIRVGRLVRGLEWFVGINVVCGSIWSLICSISVKLCCVCGYG